MGEINAVTSRSLLSLSARQCLVTGRLVTLYSPCYSIADLRQPQAWHGLIYRLPDDRCLLNQIYVSLLRAAGVLLHRRGLCQNVCWGQPNRRSVIAWWWHGQKKPRKTTYVTKTFPTINHRKLIFDHTSKQQWRTGSRWSDVADANKGRSVCRARSKVCRKSQKLCRETQPSLPLFSPGVGSVSAG